MRFGFLFMMALLAALHAFGQASQPFDVAVGGADNTCVLTLPIPEWHVQFPGISLDTNSEVEFLAAGGSGRVLGLVNSLPFRVVEVHPDGTTSPVFATGQFGADLVADAAGNLYISSGPSGGGTVVAFRPDGTRRAEFAIEATSIDLAADQCTLFYTPFDSNAVRRFNVCTGVPLPDFPSAGVEFVRIVPDGGVLTISPDWSQIVRYDAAGTLVRTYGIGFARVLALGRAGTTFFAAAPCNSSIGEYDLASGNLLRTIDVDMEDVVSLIASNGWTAALGALAVANAAAVPSLSTTMLLVLGALLTVIAFRRLM